MNIDSRLLKATIVLLLFAAGCIWGAIKITNQPLNQDSFEGNDKEQGPPATTFNVSSQVVEMSEADYRDIIRQLSVSSASGTEDELISIIEDVQTKWGAVGGEKYGMVFVEFLRSMGVPRIAGTNPDIYQLKTKYAWIALKKADSFSVETERDLLTCVYSPSKEVISRNEVAAMWCHLVARIEQGIDPNFDEKDRPPLNAPLPKYGSNIYYTGMPPEMISDPKARAEYEKAIADNHKKAEYWNNQMQLRLVRHSAIPIFVVRMSQLYGDSPEAIKELRRILQEFKISETLQQRVFSNIGKDPRVILSDKPN
jgi:hypothetical protein